MCRVSLFAILTMCVAPAFAEHPEMEVLEAHYGAAGQACDAIVPVERYCDGRSYCEIEADNRLCGDPARGTRKELVITYSCGDGTRSIQVWEGEVARAYCADTSQFRRAQVRQRPGFERCRNRRDCAPRGTSRDQVWVVESVYGARDRYCDATEAFQRACDGQSRCTVSVNNDLCGDPIDGVPKQAEIEYYCNGEQVVFSSPEGSVAALRCP